MDKLEDVLKYIESDDKDKKKKGLILHSESEGEDDEQATNGPKKKKRRRKNRKRNKNREQEENEDDEEKAVNLEFDDGSTQCISKLSDQEFDRKICLFAQRLERIEPFKNKMIPNLKLDWIEKIRTTQLEYQRK
jgi:hypothetical protein